MNTYDKTIYSEVSTALDAIGNQLLRNYYESAKLHESILDNVERTSADSAASLADSPASPDTKIDKYVRFKQMFLFQAEKHIRPGILNHLLDVLNVDYEILNINQRELKQIDEWIDDSQFEKLESFNLVMLFINLPDRMYDRAVLMMRIMSAFCQEYDMFQNTVFRYQLEDCPYYYDKWFVCRSVAEYIVKATANLNNYYNGGDIYAFQSDLAIDKFINNWRREFAKLMMYGYDSRQALQHMYMVTARLNKRRMALQDRRTST